MYAKLWDGRKQPERPTVRPSSAEPQSDQAFGFGPGGSSNPLRSGEIVQTLAIGPRKLRTLTKCRAIPGIAVGKDVRHDPHNLLTWVEKQKGVRS
jgi:hypothetical protein